jgi:hypothetical protein
VAEQDDARLRLFLAAQDAIMIGVEQAKNGLVRNFSVAVLEDLDGGTFRKVLLNSLRQLHGPVVWVVVADKAARKTDEDITGCGWGTAGHGSVSGCEQGSCRSKGCEDRNENPESREAGHAGS